MKLSKSQRLILYSLGQFYEQLNQPLIEKPLHLQTSKIAFITFVLQSGLITKQERALYKNLEWLERKHLIQYPHKMIAFTETGLLYLQKINQEIDQFVQIKDFFRKEKPRQKLQTVLR